VLISDYSQFAGADAVAVLTALRLAQTASEVTAMKLSFPPSASAGSAASPRTVAVTIHNRHEYIEAKMRHDLFGCRLEQLAAFSQGFFSLPEVGVHWSRLHGQDLQLLLTGESELSADALLSCVQFVGFPASSPLPTLVRALLQSMSSIQLRRLLLLLTQLDSLPVPLCKGYMSVRCRRSG
jgi:hypothetical protein